MHKWSYLLLGCSLAVLLLSGCYRTQSHITIKSDGSAHIELVKSLNRDTLKKQMEQSKDKSRKQLPPPGQISKEMLQNAESKAKQEGVAIVAFQEGATEGIKLSKHVDNAKDITSDFDNLQDVAKLASISELPDSQDSINLSLEVKKGFFATSYKLNTKVGSDQGGNPMSGLGGQMGENSTFTLTLPIKPGKTNAKRTEDGGKTLIWEYSAMQGTTMEAEGKTLNFVTIGASGLIGLLIILGGLGIVLRKKKPIVQTTISA